MAAGQYFSLYNEHTEIAFRWRIVLLHSSFKVKFMERSLLGVADQSETQI